MANLSTLASDANNPEFVGAMNPDSLLHVRFYERALPNRYQTQLQQRPIYDNVVFIEIHTPGNQLNIIERPKINSDERRFPLQWAHFKNVHSDDPAKQGTPLAQWPLLDVAKAEMLKAMKFFTVEQIAYASDEQIGHIGMLAGMSPLAFRDKAKAYLEAARGAATISQKDEELKKAKEELETMKAQIAELMAAKTEAQAPAPQPVPPVAPPPVAPPKDEFERAKEKHRKKYVMTEEHKAKLKAAREAAQKAKHG